MIKLLLTLLAFVTVSSSSIAAITKSSSISKGEIKNTAMDTTENLKRGLVIGDTYLGGIIFYLDASGKHGLICAQEDQSKGIIWGDVNVDAYAYGSGIGCGAGNARAMNRWLISGSKNAARVCYNTPISGFNDWYLPSDFELQLMYQNIGQGDALGLGNIGLFGANRYWSSSEHSSSVAWYTDFNSGAHDGDTKSKSYAVRAVRVF